MSNPGQPTIGQGATGVDAFRLVGLGDRIRQKWVPPASWDDHAALGSMLPWEGVLDALPGLSSAGDQGAWLLKELRL